MMSHIHMYLTVISQETLKERLDLIGRQLGLNTEVQDDKVSLGTDVFHVEVLLGDEGTIANVKLANQGEVVVSLLVVFFVNICKYECYRGRL